ncbi:MAG: cobalamin-dependent protein, partial [Proteobacteria bacterium]|nr:cobalamin-dependent protein [Pseudomonadota bacterium]
MKVLLVSPNVESLPDPVFPIGLAFIAGALKKNRIRYQVLDLCFVQDYEAAIASCVRDFTPDIIGLSLRNVDNVSYPQYVSYLTFYRRVVQTFKKYSRGLIVVGGSGFALIPAAMLNYLKTDYGILGEGEFSFVKFINEHKQHKDARAELKSGVINYHPGIIENLNDLPIPDRSKFDNAAYLRWGGMGNIQTKRGCPFHCIYCTYPLIEGPNIRLRSPRLICDEIETILEYGVNHLFVVDNEFNYPIDHAQAVCREMINRKLPIRWSCYASPGFVTPELIDLMLAAGCTGLEFGSDAA